MDERVDPADAKPDPDWQSREVPLLPAPPEVLLLPPPAPTPAPVVVKPRRWGLLIGLLILPIGLGLGWYWWTHQAAKPAPSGRAAQTQAQPVGAATIDSGDIKIILNQLGTVAPLATVTVKTQISGQLTEVGFKEGQVVQKGDFLAQIDPRPYQVALEQAQGTLAHDQGLLAQAQSDLKRYQTLSRQDSIAQQQVDNQRFLVAQYTGTVQADQAQVDSANLNIAYCHIIAPVAGQVGLRQVDPGNYVTSGDASGLVVITQMQPISVLFSVAEDQLPAIIKRIQAKAALPVEAYDRGNVNLLSTGQLATLDNQIDTTTGTLKIRATFANQDQMLYPNQFVNARLLVNSLAGTVRVPVQAVQRGEPGTFVYVINANNTVSVRPVKLGPVDGGFQAVTSGLAVGDKVVTDGTDRLRDGAAVTVPPPGQTAATARNRTPPAAGTTPPAPAQAPLTAPATPPPSAAAPAAPPQNPMNKTQ